MQKAQSTAQPTWLEMQMVARCQSLLICQLFVAAWRAVAGFAAIAFRHPDRLDALAIGEAQQIADGAVGGNETSSQCVAGRRR